MWSAAGSFQRHAALAAESRFRTLLSISGPPALPKAVSPLRSATARHDAGAHTRPAGSAGILPATLLRGGKPAGETPALPEAHTRLHP